MRPSLDGLNLIVPASLDEALSALAQDSEARPFAGGTDLMVQLEAGLLPRRRYISVWHLPELRGIREHDAGMTIGALATYSDVRASGPLARDYPLLTQAAAETGGVATQNRGTIGGNIANASPAADTPPALLAYDAEIELRSSGGTRRRPYRGFHAGYKQMDLRPGEIITAVHLPRRDRGWRDEYRKVGPRKAQAISKVCFAGTIRVVGGRVEDVRLALGSVAPTVVRCTRAEEVLRGRTLDAEVIAAASAAVALDIAPIDDIRSTAEYRRRVAQNLVADFLARSQK
jgi:CO/xanthine dehydrogenase FAD-binding subunit